MGAVSLCGLVAIGKLWDPGGGVLQGGLHPPRGFCLVPGPLFPSELQHKIRVKSEKLLEVTDGCVGSYTSDKSRAQALSDLMISMLARNSAASLV
jgi:hypothetical protein